MPAYLFDGLLFSHSVRLLPHCQDNLTNAHVVQCSSLTSLTLNIHLLAPTIRFFSLMCHGHQQSPFLLGPFDSNPSVHMSVVCLWFPLFQKEPPPPKSPSPDLSHVPPRLCPGDQQPNSSFLHTAIYILLAVLCMFCSCVYNKS